MSTNIEKETKPTQEVTTQVHGGHVQGAAAPVIPTEHQSHASEHSGEQHPHSGEQHPHSGEHHSHSGEQHSHSGEHHSHSGEHHSHSSGHHHKDHSHSSEKETKKFSEIKIGENEVNHQYIFNKHPTEHVSEDVFRFEQAPMPRDPSENELLIRLTYISIDSFSRNRMSEKSEFIQPFKLNEALEGEATAEIIKSNSSKYPAGQQIVGFFKWTKYQIINTQHQHVNLIPADINPSFYLSIFGTPGFTAYFGLTEYAKLKPQHKMLVSGASGSVGLFVGQIARAQGCQKLIGLDSSEDKVKQSLLFGYNQCYNTNSHDLNQLLTTEFPEGIDVYWDNVGGATLDVVIEHMRPHGRILLCGTKSECHSSDDKHYSLTKFDRIIAKSITIQGVFCYDFVDRFPKAYKKLLHWYHEGKIKTKETALEGFQHVPKAFASLLSGDTLGKTVVHVTAAQPA